MKMLAALWAPATVALLSLCAIEAMPDAGTRSPTSGSWTLVGWNDLGMHCMDGDYGVFSILPPFNTLEAQLIDQNGDLVTSPGGVVPAFVASAAPVLGTTIQISAQNTSGAASVMALVVSDEPASIPTPLGGSILVHLMAAPMVAPIPASGWVASLALPTDPSLTGFTVRAQVAIADPGAAFGLGFSEGLCLIFGP